MIAKKTIVQIRDKIFALESSNIFLYDELILTSCDLEIYRDCNSVAYSEVNRSLKAMHSKLSGVQKQLQDANIKVLEQGKQIAEIPTLKAGLQPLQDKLSAKMKHLEAIEQMTKDKDGPTEKMAKVVMTGFERCLNMAMILVPSLDTSLLKAENKAKGGRIFHQGQVIYDPALVISPVADGAETEAIEDEAIPANTDKGAAEGKEGKNFKKEAEKAS